MDWPSLQSLDIETHWLNREGLTPLPIPSNQTRSIPRKLSRLCPTIAIQCQFIPRKRESPFSLIPRLWTLGLTGKGKLSFRQLDSFTLALKTLGETIGKPKSGNKSKACIFPCFAGYTKSSFKLIFPLTKRLRRKSGEMHVFSHSLMSKDMTGRESENRKSVSPHPQSLACKLAPQFHKVKALGMTGLFVFTSWVEKPFDKNNFNESIPSLVLKWMKEVNDCVEVW